MANVHEGVFLYSQAGSKLYASLTKKLGWVSTCPADCPRLCRWFQTRDYCFVFLFSSPSVPRLLFDGWSYQDYMTVLGSEDEIEELGSELIDVAKVIKRCVFL